MLAIVCIAATLLSAALTGAFRRYALTRGLLDVPNERSSHHTPTPRGGGVAIVLTMLLALPALGLLHVLPWRVVGGLAGAGAVAALVGYADDHGLVSVLPRLGAHFVAAGIVVAAVGTDSIADALALAPAYTWASVVLGVLYVVWMLNLTNFMDGIDGLASTEVITVCLGAALLSHGVRNTSSPSAGAAMVLAAVTAGFLSWNWPPARIFMGDAGSGFLGAMLAALSLVGGNERTAFAWMWLVLAGVFIVDATVTLLFRIARGETFYKAHRSHAYQHAAQRWSHKRVTIAVALVNILWLWPWAANVAAGKLPGPNALAIAYAPLVMIAVLLRAGRQPAQPGNAPTSS